MSELRSEVMDLPQDHDPLESEVMDTSTLSILPDAKVTESHAYGAPSRGHGASNILAHSKLCHTSAVLDAKWFQQQMVKRSGFAGIRQLCILSLMIMLLCVVLTIDPRAFLWVYCPHIFLMA